MTKRVAAVLLALALVLLCGCKDKAVHDPSPEGVSTPETDPAMKQSNQMQTNGTPAPGTSNNTAAPMPGMAGSMGGQPPGSGPK